MEKLDKQQLKTKVYETIAEVLREDVHDLNPNAHIIHDCGADSLDVVEISLDLEEQLSITIDHETEKKLTDCTLEEIFKIVKDLYYEWSYEWYKIIWIPKGGDSEKS